ncbi:MAG TPA: hypothetical protein VJM31_05680 [Vicinamibacterales bacterium]|nr:hypothetical protein [Vicinamibacterales bacterium]
MARIKCNDCGTEVSGSLSTCPACGAALKRRTALWAALKWTVILIIFIPLATCTYIFGTVLYKAERVEIRSE